ncbi:MAG: hypothetical protein QME58_10785 [Bacteroidota bacterium]|nr:hypothetical protein [Bacteroidota bacterium]
MENILPKWVKKIPNKKKFLRNILQATAFREMQEFQKKILVFEKKWGGKFEKVSKKLKKAKHENFQLWDDLIVWEGYRRAFQEWQK